MGAGAPGDAPRPTAGRTRPRRRHRSTPEPARSTPPPREPIPAPPRAPGAADAAASREPIPSHSSRPRRRRQRLEPPGAGRDRPRPALDPAPRLLLGLGLLRRAPGGDLRGIALGTIGRNKVDRGESTRFRSLASAGRTFGIVGTVLAAIILVAVIAITQLLDVSAESIDELIDEVRQEIESQ